MTHAPNDFSTHNLAIPPIIVWGWSAIWVKPHGTLHEKDKKTNKNVWVWPNTASTIKCTQSNLGADLLWVCLLYTEWKLDISSLMELTGTFCRER